MTDQEKEPEIEAIAEIDAIEENDAEPIGSVDTVTLCDEEGNEYQFDLLGYVDYEEKLYAVMVPAEFYDDEEDQVVIMETYFEGNEPNFLFVEDEALAQKILDEYAKLDESEEV